MQPLSIISAAAGSATETDGFVPSRNWAAERARLNDPTRSELTTAERGVLDAIEVHIADHVEGWPTQKRIATQTGLSERQVRRCIEVLVRRDFLRVRFVLPGGRLPSGNTTDSVRLVYARGPRLVKAAGPPRRLPRGLHDRVDPDSMAAKGIKPKDQTTPLPLEMESRGPGPTDVRKCGFNSLVETVLAATTERVVPRPAMRSEASEPSSDDVTTVLEHWRITLWPDLRGRLETSSRVAIVLARLQDGFTCEELCWVADAATQSDWHQAEGQRHRLTVEVLYGKSEIVGELAPRGRAIHESKRRRIANERARAAAARERQQPDEAPITVVDNTFARMFAGPFAKAG